VGACGGQKDVDGGTHCREEWARGGRKWGERAGGQWQEGVCDKVGSDVVGAGDSMHTLMAFCDVMWEGLQLSNFSNGQEMERQSTNSKFTSLKNCIPLSSRN